MPDKSTPVVLYCAAGNRSAFAAKTLAELGYDERQLAARRLHRLEAERLRDRAAAHALAGAAHALLAPPPDPRDRRGRPAEAARLQHPADRRRRPRLPRLALPRGGGRRPARDHRRRHRRRVEPAAPDRALAEHARHAEGRQREARDRGAQPGRRGHALPRAADLREHRPDPRRRLGHHRRRRRQLPDALPGERRLRLARDPRRARLDLPLRGPGHRLQAARRPVLPLPLPRAAAARAGAVVLRGRRARRAARHRRHAADERGAQARARDRRAADRPAAALRRARTPSSPRCRSSATRTARSAATHPTITEYIDYVEFCAR